MKKKLLSSILVLTLLASFAVPFLAEEDDDDGKLSRGGSIVSGCDYVFAISGIKDSDDRTPQHYAVKTQMSADPHGLAYGLFPVYTDAAEDFLWTVCQTSKGYTLQAKASGQYLNLKADTAYLSDKPQDLTLTVKGDSVQISVTDNGKTYYLRFTNTYKPNSCWHAGTSSSSSTFTVYGTEQYDTEYDNSDQEPLFSVACFSDLHVDYGLQGLPSPVRKGTVKAAEFVRRELGGANVVLVGGDVTSNNGQNTWTDGNIRRSLKSVQDALALASYDEWVLYVSGNHENEAAIAAGVNYYSGDYEDYMTETAGPFADDFYFSDMNMTSKYDELLCYHYSLEGMEFIGINTPYRDTRSNGYIYPAQISWVEQKLAQIGADKTVIIFCHYPLNYIQTPSGVSGDSKTMLTAALEKYPNVLYCYGHIHGDDHQYVWYDTSELIGCGKNSVLLENGAYETDGYHTVHMGSMGYYNNQFQPGGLQAAEPQIVQLMMIYFYQDHITFRMYNVGEKSGDAKVYELGSHTIMRDMSVQLAQHIPAEDNSDSSDNSSDASTNVPTDVPAAGKSALSTGAVVVLVISGVIILAGVAVVAVSLSRKK